MTEVNLLPPELRRRQQRRTATTQVIAGALVVVGLLVLLFIYESSRLSDANSALQAQNQRNAALQRQITGLQRFADLQNELQQRQQLVDGLRQGNVAWSGVLHDLSMVIPGEVYVTNMTGTITVGAGGVGVQVSPTGLIGGLTFQGVAVDHPAVALWLDRVSEVTGWDNAWVSAENTAEGTGTTGGTNVTFSGSVDLGQDAATTTGGNQ